MEWNHDESRHSATTDVGWDRYSEAVDEYLATALPCLAQAYSYEDCPVIVFELWASSGRLIVYDSPVGICLRERKERVCTQLISRALMACQAAIWQLPENARQQAQTRLEQSVWEATRTSLTAGKGNTALAYFRSYPFPIALPKDEYDRAFELLSGEWVDVP
ncbi:MULTISPECIES: hypothetical protein [unclassified Leptolyngbya]|uniref:hypothetical protein n=1 Tax=unclassified Leptolyngbya TaxID=2650499 RepID=UPI001686758D|nr:MULTISPECIES: hypothetical protein [unclassified Leptolyngbya]MBD1910932.1 hypothetical protein [Leptolyngbya sp. FACHB-8]MBD2158402.1 hypothetical protein [Leptolyngbya sp. FACHB-16]